MDALRFKLQDREDCSPPEAFHALLCDLIAAHRAGFPVLRTQAYYPDSSDLGDTPPDEFMIEVVDEDALQALQRFLQNRPDVKRSSILVWNPAEAMSPLQSGIWCYTYHAGLLRLAPLTLAAPASPDSVHATS